MDKIFTPRLPVKKQELNSGLWFSYENGILKIYDETDSEVWSQESKNGDGFVVFRNKKTGIFVDEMKLPQTRAKVVGFLLGTPKKCYARNKDACVEWAESLRKKYYSPGYEEIRYEAKNYLIFQYTEEEGTDPKMLCLYIEEEISKKEILELVPLMVYPYSFTQKVLYEQFGITAEELNCAIMGE